MLKSQDISVIVQGKINKKETVKCLKSIRKYLPDAEIILSTWEGSDVTFLQGLYNILVLNKDPGAEVIKEHKYEVIYNNINRQLFSTQEGLKKASRKYVLKLRSDLILTNNTFLHYFDKFQKKSKNYNLFERKILIPALYTKFYTEKPELETPFHFSDWWFFGLKKDLEKYFLDIGLAKEPEFTKYFDLEENKSKKSVYSCPFKFAPEQYFGYVSFSKYFSDIKMEDAADVNPQIMQKYKECLINNFIVLEFKQSGIYTNKYLQSKCEKYHGVQYLGLCNNYEYENIYKKYCDKNYLIKTKSPVLINYEFSHELFRLYKHFFKLKCQKKGFYCKLEEIFINIPSVIVRILFVFFKIILNLMIGKNN